MNVVGAIRQLIIDNIAAAEGTMLDERIFPVVLPQAEALPAVAIRLTTVGPTNSKPQVSDTDRVVIVVMTFSFDYYEAERIDEQIRRAIDGYEGAVTTSPDNVDHGLKLVQFSDTSDDFADESKAFVRVSNYIVDYWRETPGLPFGPPWIDGSTAWFASLDEYTSNEAAILAGKVPGDVYLTAEGHVQAPGGLPMIVK